MRRHAFVQQGFVVEAGEDGHRAGRLVVQTIELDGQNPTERTQLVQKARRLIYLNHSQGPSPDAVGSRSQSGGVSHTKARMAITHRSYWTLARSSRQKNARQKTAVMGFDPVGIGLSLSAR